MYVAGNTTTTTSVGERPRKYCKKEYPKKKDKSAVGIKISNLI